MSTSPTSEHGTITPPRRKRGWRDHLWSGLKWLGIALFVAYLWASFVRTEFNLYTLIEGMPDIKRIMLELAHPDLSWQVYDEDGDIVRDRRTAPDIAASPRVKYEFSDPTVGKVEDGFLILNVSYEGSFALRARVDGAPVEPPVLYFVHGRNDGLDVDVDWLPQSQPAGTAKRKYAVRFSVAKEILKEYEGIRMPTVAIGEGTLDDPYGLFVDKYKLVLIDETAARPKPGTLPVLLDSMNETVQISLVGTLLSVLFSFPLAFFASRNLTRGSAAGRTAYGVTRFVFNVLRAFPPVILALLFVFMVGPGPFPGVLALGLHSIGMLGKLFSEAIEQIDPAPIEAVKATGASNFMVVWYGILPQVMPQFLAFSLYRWDINIRMSIILGIVGAGGIGFLIDQYIRLFQFSKASTCFLIILVAVTLLDWASAYFRERLG